MSIIFFGTSSFAIPALEKLTASDLDISAVVTTPDEASGRNRALAPPPVKTAAERLGLTVLQPENLKGFQIPGSPDVGVVVSYGKILPPEILDAFPKGILNIHPSLLPKYRGPSPIQYALLKGEMETGVSIMKIDTEVDHGPLLRQETIRIEDSDTYPLLHDRLALAGADLLLRILPEYLSGKLEPKEQDHTRATFTKKISKDDGRIDWHRPVRELWNRYRAFTPWPGIWTTWNGKTLKITTCRLYPGQPNHAHQEEYIGKIYDEDGSVFVPCSEGHLELLRVQLEGKKESDIRIFLNGYREFVGSLLE